MGKKKSTKSNKGFTEHKLQEALSIKKVQVEYSDEMFSTEQLCQLWEEGHITGDTELLLFQALLSSGWIYDIPFFNTKQWKVRLKELRREEKIKDPYVL